MKLFSNENSITILPQKKYPFAWGALLMLRTILKSYSLNQSKQKKKTNNNGTTRLRELTRIYNIFPTIFRLKCFEKRFRVTLVVNFTSHNWFSFFIPLNWTWGRKIRGIPGLRNWNGVLRIYLPAVSVTRSNRQGKLSIWTSLFGYTRCPISAVPSIIWS